MFPADIAPITHDTVSVGALVYRVSVTALGALGVHPAVASGVVGGQEVVGQIVWGRGLPSSVSLLPSSFLVSCHSLLFSFPPFSLLKKFSMVFR